jgi:hypothetical protein
MNKTRKNRRNVTRKKPRVTQEIIVKKVPSEPIAYPDPKSFHFNSPEDCTLPPEKYRELREKFSEGFIWRMSQPLSMTPIKLSKEEEEKAEEERRKYNAPVTDKDIEDFIENSEKYNKEYNDFLEERRI